MGLRPSKSAGWRPASDRGHRCLDPSQRFELDDINLRRSTPATRSRAPFSPRPKTCKPQGSVFDPLARRRRAPRPHLSIQLAQCVPRSSDLIYPDRISDDLVDLTDQDRQSAAAPRRVRTRLLQVIEEVLRRRDTYRSHLRRTSQLASWLERCPFFLHRLTRGLQRVRTYTSFVTERRAARGRRGIGREISPSNAFAPGYRRERGAGHVGREASPETTKTTNGKGGSAEWSRPARQA